MLKFVTCGWYTSNQWPCPSNVTKIEVQTLADLRNLKLGNFILNAEQWQLLTERSVRNYHYSLSNSPEEGSYHLLRGESFKSLHNYALVNKLKNVVTFLKRPAYPSLREWKCEKRKVVEEYCWAITQAAGRSRYGPLVFSVLEFAFQMVPLVYTTYIYSSRSSELCKIRLSLDLPESYYFLSRRESPLKIWRHLKVNT